MNKHAFFTGYVEKLAALPADPEVQRGLDNLKRRKGEMVNFTPAGQTGGQSQTYDTRWSPGGTFSAGGKDYTYRDPSAALGERGTHVKINYGGKTYVVPRNETGKYSITHNGEKIGITAKGAGSAPAANTAATSSPAASPKVFNIFGANSLGKTSPASPSITANPPTSPANISGKTSPTAQPSISNTSPNVSDFISKNRGLRLGVGGWQGVPGTGKSPYGPMLSGSGIGGGGFMYGTQKAKGAEAAPAANTAATPPAAPPKTFNIFGANSLGKTSPASPSITANPPTSPVGGPAATTPSVFGGIGGTTAQDHIMNQPPAATNKVHTQSPGALPIGSPVSAPKVNRDQERDPETGLYSDTYYRRRFGGNLEKAREQRRLDMESAPNISKLKDAYNEADVNVSRNQFNVDTARMLTEGRVGENTWWNPLGRLGAWRLNPSGATSNALSPDLNISNDYYGGAQAEMTATRERAKAKQAWDDARARQQSLIDAQNNWQSTPNLITKK